MWGFFGWWVPSAGGGVGFCAGRGLPLHVKDIINFKMGLEGRSPS